MTNCPGRDELSLIRDLQREITQDLKDYKDKQFHKRPRRPQSDNNLQEGHEFLAVYCGRAYLRGLCGLRVNYSVFVTFASFQFAVCICSELLYSEDQYP
ncbi:MAG: hypothetical protein JOZ31_19020 [Verrucomicrobia bacterium]|nr:hypothetical protein [Verrucomicrobiota bacterium]